MPITSALGPGLAVEGTLLQVGSTASPPVFTTIANCTDMSMPTISETVDVTNFGSKWRLKIATLLDMGKVTFKLFWIPTEPTQDNTGSGLRFLMLNQLPRTFQFVYPDGLNSADVVPAYVTSFKITGKTGGVFEAEMELTNYAPPTLV